MASSHGDFSAPPEVTTFHGLLFDMDGTIIDSTPAIVKHWTTIGKELGVDPAVILATSHGRRSIDVLKAYDPSRATPEYVSKIEGQIPTLYGSDAVELPGSRTLLAGLEAAGAPWAIVTSGSRPLVAGWLELMKLTFPRNLVTAEDVPNGKPDPACYRLGYSKLYPEVMDEHRILVLEDAPAGVRAGKAAGFKVVAVATSHSVEEVLEAGADWVVKDLASVKLVGYEAEKQEVSIEITNAWVA
ncbi:HAD-like protein [Trichodelitschia bisporula]|uniref:HAD-like protein n=1 Tax=Trichodelitschia bisporula TaxID=703511 RepID=A0A6G1HZJ7_9PEZI|nr:HAD-like protein [Trichodelitschia bisporula]